MLVSTRRIFALPETRPDPSASTTRPLTSAPFGTTVCPPTTIGSTRLAVNSSPALFVALLIGLIRATVNSVPSGTSNVLGAAGFGGAAATAFGTLGAAGGGTAAGAGCAGTADSTGVAGAAFADAAGSAVASVG